MNAPLPTEQHVQYEFVDRYSALGIARPDPATMCHGQCEGVGVYPEYDQSEPAWQEAHRKSCSLFGRLKRVFHTRRLNEFLCDGWHFVKCERCNGTGKDPTHAQ